MHEIVLRATDMSVRFGGLTAVDGVSLTLRSSHIHGLIGPNGAGKSTCFNAINGLVRPSSGSVELNGVDITNTSASQRATLGMRRTFQSVQLIKDFTVLENVLVGLHTNLTSGKGGWLRALRSSSEVRAQEAVVEILDVLGMTHTLYKPVTDISFAEQRFVEIARALIAKPVMLMLDEPAAGLSPQEIEVLDRLLRTLRTDWGMSILLVEHVLSLIMDLSDEVTVLDNGKKIAYGIPGDVAKNPAVMAAYLGKDVDAEN